MISSLQFDKALRGLYEINAVYVSFSHSEYRNQFKTVEEFRRAFGKLTKEEARALISAENASVSIKAAILQPGKMQRKRRKERREADD